jgi:hypothetical protein
LGQWAVFDDLSFETISTRNDFAPGMLKSLLDRGGEAILLPLVCLTNALPIGRQDQVDSKYFQIQSSSFHSSMSRMILNVMSVVHVLR